MGRRHQVDYPQVPQSHQLNESSNTNYNSRYSWMDNPHDSDRRLHAQNVRIQDQTPIAIPASIPEKHIAMPAELPTQELPVDGWTKQRAPQTLPIVYNATVPQQPLQQSQVSLPPPPPAHMPDVKQPEKAALTENRPEKLPIAPDVNPLSPQLPVYASGKERRTTNIGMTSPPNTDFAPTAYQPISQPIRGESWHHSLGSCAEPSICLTGLFCPCVLYGKLQYRLSLKSEKKDGTNMLGYETVNGSCIAWSLLCGINGVLSGIQRSRIRRSYEMVDGSGSCLSDCLLGCCCCCCVLAQNEKELKYREENAWRAGATGQEGYVPPSGMTFSSRSR